MPLASATATPASFSIDRVAHVIRFERDLDAAPEQVFRAWTQPEQLALWWDPAGQPLARCEIDLRIGGAFTFVGRNHPEMPFAGVYREIASPDRLVFEAMGSIGRVLLSPTTGGTHMVVEIACASAEQLDQFVRMNVHEGTSRTLDNLVVHMAR
jgi:uncharacterized protein YndB with AHSA1/START domain